MGDLGVLRSYEIACVLCILVLYIEIEKAFFFILL